MSKTPLFRYLRRSLSLARVANKTGMSPEEVVDRYRENETPAEWSRISRRHFLATSTIAAAGLAACKKAPVAPAAEAPKGPREVVVIGAGVAGLTCAYRLHQAGVPVRVFEGQKRVGGRMWSLRGHFPENLVCELGGELVDTGHEAIRGMCDELGLELDDFDAGRSEARARRLVLRRQADSGQVGWCGRSRRSRRRWTRRGRRSPARW